MSSSSIARSVVGYKRTLDHLKAWPLKLPSNLKKVSLRFNTSERSHEGLRLFTYQHLPQIKFHNPAVKFMVSEDSKECVIELSNGKGETNILEVEEKTHREIKVVIEELYPAIIMDSIQTDSMYNTQITQ